MTILAEAGSSSDEEFDPVMQWSAECHPDFVTT